MHPTTSIAVMLAIITPAAAQAQVQPTFRHNFTATAFGSTGSSPAPVAEVTGSFAINWNADSRAFSLASLTLNIGTMSFDVANSNIALINSGNSRLPDFLIGGNSGGISFGGGLEDFQIAYISATRSITDFSYSDRRGNYTSTNVRMEPFGPVAPPAVPEPEGWAMMIGGFGVAGVAMRRRRAVRAVAC